MKKSLKNKLISAGVISGVALSIYGLVKLNQYFDRILSENRQEQIQVPQSSSGEDIYFPRLVGFSDKKYSYRPLSRVYNQPCPISFKN